MLNANRQLRIHSKDGISIIEVLTSMAVAAIGVFGVMVMIPFAVKQSQTGLDADAANALGRNVLEEMHVEGLFQVQDNGDFSRILVVARDDGNTPGSEAIRSCSVNLDADIPRAPGLLHFDPVGFADGLTGFTVDPPNNFISITAASSNRRDRIDIDQNGVFNPLVDLPSAFDPILPTSVLTDIEADRFCRSSDQLFYETDQEGVDDIAPPQPLFDTDIAGGVEVKRQSSGRISWSAILAPEKSSFLTTAPSSRYRTHVLVYRDRFIDQSPVDPAFPLGPTNRVNSNYGIYQTSMAVPAGTNGFQSAVTQIEFDTTVNPNATPVNQVEVEIVRGSWVMLINRLPFSAGAPSIPNSGFDYPAAGPGYREQIMFARVTRVSTDGTIVTVDGGSFDFLPAGIPMADATGSTETYMVHLKNVINVYERSISVER